MRTTWALAVALATSVAFAAPASAGRSAVVAGCANPALPLQILDGTYAGSGTPLPVIDVRAPAAPLVLAIAADEPTRELGLMCVTHLRPHTGMVFVFASAMEQDFWMKNTLVPLDMVWVGSDGTVTSVAARVPASTRDTPNERVARRSGTGRYVIELPDGEAASDGIRAGVTLPLLTLNTTK